MTILKSKDRGWISCFLLLVAGVAGAADQSILIEAESFSHLGGWKLDTQFIDLMGSPYVLAHGLGQPVANAKTTFEVDAPGSCYLWVRTKNWVPGARAALGRFRVIVNGKPLPREFGAAQPDWGWECGGKITVKQKTVTIELEDLTGFDGRCDAILLLPKVTDVPENGNKPQVAWRHLKQIRDDTEYDLVVVGGGLAGTSAAISAARMGLNVALIQNRPMLGGNGSEEIRVAPRGKFPAGRYPHLGDIVKEISPYIKHNVNSPEPYKAAQEKRRRVVDAEPTLHLFLNHHAYRVEMSGSRIAAVWALDTHGHFVRRFKARYVVDATGHGTIGFQAGAQYAMKAKGRMGSSNLWRWDFTSAVVPFPETPWALPLTAAGFPYPRVGSIGKGEWFWESGFDKDPLKDREQVRDHNLRAIFGSWNALKNHGAYAKRDPSGANHATAVLRWVGYISGTRETLQLLGDVLVTKEDVVSNRSFPDACVPSTWSIDLHYPHTKYANTRPIIPLFLRLILERRSRFISFPTAPSIQRTLKISSWLGAIFR